MTAAHAPCVPASGLQGWRRHTSCRGSRGCPESFAPHLGLNLDLPWEFQRTLPLGSAPLRAAAQLRYVCGDWGVHFGHRCVVWFGVFFFFLVPFVQIFGFLRSSILSAAATFSGYPSWQVPVPQCWFKQEVKPVMHCLRPLCSQMPRLAAALSNVSTPLTFSSWLSFILTLWALRCQATLRLWVQSPCANRKVGSARAVGRSSVWRVAHGQGCLPPHLRPLAGSVLCT